MADNNFDQDEADLQTIAGRKDTPEVATPAAPPMDPDEAELHAINDRGKPDYQNMGWGTVAGNAAKNFAWDAPSAVWDAAKDTYQLARHPYEEGAKVHDAAKGAYQYMEGEDTPQAQAVGNAWNEFKQNWPANAKQYISEHPAHLGIDAGLVLAAPEYGLEKAGMETLAKVPRYMRLAVDPLSQTDTIARKGIPIANRIGNEVVGHWGTGTGGDILNTATEAGYQGGAQDRMFHSNTNQSGDPYAVMPYFKQAVNDFRQQRWNQYHANKAALARDSSRIDLAPVIKTFDNQDKEFSSSPGAGAAMTMPNTLNTQTEPMRNAISKMLADWNGRGIAEDSFGKGINQYYTPSGLDLLKKNLNALRNNPALMTRPESEVILNRVVDSLRGEIINKAPAYGSYMQDYTKATENLNALEKELGLGNKGNPAAAIRKLMSSTRNNVAASNGLRGWIAKNFMSNPNAQVGMAGIAGQVLSSKFPRTLVNTFLSKGLPVGAAAGAFGLSHYGLSPFLTLPSLPFILAAQSPYVMGKMANLAGKAGRAAESVPWRGLGYAGYESKGPFQNASPPYKPVWAIQRNLVPEE